MAGGGMGLGRHGQISTSGHSVPACGFEAQALADGWLIPPRKMKMRRLGSKAVVQPPGTRVSWRGLWEASCFVLEASRRPLEVGHSLIEGIRSDCLNC